MNILQLMTTYVHVVRCGSFSRAADQLNVTTSMVSKQISTLEDHLGSQLLNRTTRRLGLTNTGESYYHSCIRILEDVSRAEQSVSGTQRAPHGTLKVRVPHTVAALHISSIISEFTRKYPSISITIMIDQHSSPSIDIIARNFDIVLMFGPINSSTLIIRELATVIWAPYASANYLAKHGVPRQPDDLRHHNCLSHLAVSPDRKWELRGKRTATTVKVSGSLSVNSVMVLREAVQNDVGIAMLPSFSITREEIGRSLVRVLPGYVGPERNLQLAFVRDRMPPRRTSLFIDFLVERFGVSPWESLI